ncbi:MAG: hypothetical protein HY482_02340 [Candidatus Wildermuthbacteria bacterium]|nr:hypothetical protein [Candidatus Wildermuthbacteria bacterium]
MARFIKKVQNLPESSRRVILWSIMGVLAAGLVFFWGRDAIQTIRGLGASAGPADGKESLDQVIQKFQQELEYARQQEQ